MERCRLPWHSLSTEGGSALALVDDRLSSEGTGLGLGVSNPRLVWILLGITKIGSRQVTEIAPGFMIFFSLFGKFGAILDWVLAPILATNFCLLFSKVVGCGISFVQFVFLNDSRSQFIFRFSIYMGISLPYYFTQYAESGGYGLVRTSSRWFNDFVFVIFTTGSLWCVDIYHVKRDFYFPKGGVPSKEPILLQIWVSMKGIPIYVSLLTLCEYMIERGWTRCYLNISNVGVPSYIFWMILYLVLVEFGVYWMHRGLHRVKPLYKWLHATHHIYNKEIVLEEYASLVICDVEDDSVWAL